jgi:hypothetical protein
VGKIAAGKFPKSHKKQVARQNFPGVTPANFLGYNGNMKVEGPGKAQGASNTKKSGKTEKSGSHFGDFLTSGTAATESAAQTQSIGSVDSLLALQGAEDPTARAAKKRMRERAATILGKLDEVRIAMLSGRLTVGHMIDIADVIASHREKINDPALTDLMDEIDLRAQVELAKMRIALDEKA